MRRLLVLLFCVSSVLAQTRGPVQVLSTEITPGDACATTGWWASGAGATKGTIFACESSVWVAVNDDVPGAGDFDALALSGPVTSVGEATSISTAFQLTGPVTSVGLATSVTADAIGAAELDETDTYTFVPEQTFLGGISVGTTGVFHSNVTSGAAYSAFQLVDDLTPSGTRDAGNILKVGSADSGKYQMLATYDGKFVFGNNASLAPSYNAVLGFLAPDADNSSYWAAVLGLSAHQGLASSRTYMAGLAGGVISPTSLTGLTQNAPSGVLGMGMANSTIPDLSSRYLCGVRGRISGYTSSGNYFKDNVDAASTITEGIPRGNWAHATPFWADYTAWSGGIGTYPTSRPAIGSGIRVPIQGFPGSNAAASPAGEQWAVYGESPDTAAANFPLTTGFMRITYPRRADATAGARHYTQLWFEPWPETADALAGMATSGDVVFLSGAGTSTVPPKQAGLWEHDGTALVKLAGLQRAETVAADWTWSTDKKALFRDSAIHIQSASDGDLDLTADTNIDLNAPTVRLGTTDKIQFRDTAISINSAADGYLDAVADTGIRIGKDTTDHVNISGTDGTLTLVGAAKTWEDLRVSTFEERGSAPTYYNLRGNVAVYGFPAATDKELHFAVQMPHSWAVGTTVKPHVHWSPASTSTSLDNRVYWKLEYTIADIHNGTNTDQDFGATNTVGSYDATAIDEDTEEISQYRHYITGLPNISMSGYGISTIILCRLYRDADNLADDYTDISYLLSVDFHYEVDSLGSNGEYSK